MPELDSPHWFHKEGACVKHGIPEVPCPACLAEADPDVTVRFTEADRNQVDWDPEFKLVDLLPAAYPWLKDRVVA